MPRRSRPGGGSRRKAAVGSMIEAGGWGHLGLLDASNPLGVEWLSGKGKVVRLTE
jgi:hypothetical protein